MLERPLNKRLLYYKKEYRVFTIQKNDGHQVIVEEISTYKRAHKFFKKSSFGFGDEKRLQQLQLDLVSELYFGNYIPFKHSVLIKKSELIGELLC